MNLYYSIPGIVGTLFIPNERVLKEIQRQFETFCSYPYPTQLACIENMVETMNPVCRRAVVDDYYFKLCKVDRIAPFQAKPEKYFKIIEEYTDAMPGWIAQLEKNPLPGGSRWDSPNAFAKYKTAQYDARCVVESLYASVFRLYDMLIRK